MKRVQKKRRKDRRRSHQEKSKRVRRATIGAGAGIGATLALAAPAAAQDFTVTNLADSGPGSLRDAIVQANTNPGSDSILFQSGLSGSIAVASPMEVTDPVNISGNQANVTLDGGGTTGILRTGQETGDAIRVDISWLAFKDGSSGNGGAIDAYNTWLNIGTSTFTGNKADVGGAIYSAGGGQSNIAQLNISQSTLSGNTASVGGAILAGTSSTGVNGSTFNNNRAVYGGGAIATAYSPPDSSIGVANSTFNRNSGGFIGGAIAGTSDSENVSLYSWYSTISGNQASFVGGGIGGSFADAEIQDSIIENNFAYYGPDLYGGSFNGPAPRAGGPGCGCDQIPFDTSFSFIGDASGATINETVPGSNILNGGDALLGRLADNGGFTKTMALSADSPPVNKGGGNLGVGSDQRDEHRPVLFPNVPKSAAAGGNFNDMGAYELQYTAPPPPPPPVVDRPFLILTGTPDRKTGSNSIGVDIPAAGTVQILGYNTFRSTSTHFDAKGVYKVKAVPKGNFKKRLNKRGRARHIVRFMYTPDVGRRLAKGRVFGFFKGVVSGKAKAAAMKRIQRLDGWPGR